MERLMFSSRIFLVVVVLSSVALLIYFKNQDSTIMKADIKNPPEAVVGVQASRVTLLRGGYILLNGAGSFDPDGGEIMNYRWQVLRAPDQDLIGSVIYDGPEPSPPEQAFSDGDVGEWIYMLEVTDDDGQKSSTTKKVSVQKSIISLTNPQKANSGETDLLADDFVLGIQIGGEAMAYPAKTAYPYGIINDTVGGMPIVVFFCEGCQTGSVKERRVSGRVFTFLSLGGTLEEENYLVTDQETGSVWNAVYGNALSGPQAGAALNDLNFSLVSWSDWLSEHPASYVLVEKN